MKRAVIIGAGVGGIATAGLLAKAGWQVDVYESKSIAGGRAGLKETEGYRFDTGPSWYLMPEVYEHYFELLGENVANHLDLIKLDPAYKVFFDYRDPIIVTGDSNIDEPTFDSVEQGAGQALHRYVTGAERTYELAKKYFLYNTFRSLRSLLQPEVLRHMVTLVTLLTRSLQSYVSRFITSLPLQQILQYPAVFLGTSPFNAPAMYHLMSYLDFKQGVYYPQGGMYTIVEALQEVAEKNGARFHFDAPVAAIRTADKRTTGITLEDGTKVDADLVISNADLHFTETVLVPEALRSYPEKYWDKKVASPSALLMYLGVKGKLPELTHHNLLFVEKWRENFEQMFDTPAWPEHPSVYVCKPGATDPSVAPKGHENLFVLVPLPAGVFKDKAATSKYADHCLELIAEHCGIEDLADRVTYKELFGPDDFAAELHAWQGTALGSAHTLMQSAMFRPGSRSKKLKNLFYVGGDAQPGIGLPMCLISAELVYKHLIGDTAPGPLNTLKVPKHDWRI